MAKALKSSVVNYPAVVQTELADLNIEDRASTTEAKKLIGKEHLSQRMKIKNSDDEYAAFVGEDPQVNPGRWDGVTAKSTGHTVFVLTNFRFQFFRGCREVPLGPHWVSRGIPEMSRNVSGVPRGTPR